MVEIVNIEQSVAILIDGNNLEKSIHKLHNSTRYVLDYQEFIPKILKKRSLKKMMYFREGEFISNKLTDKLKQHYFGITKPCGKSVDVPLTIAAVRLSEKVDTIIIFSGDVDYLDLVDYLQSNGVRVEIVSTDHSVSGELVKKVDNYTKIYKNDCICLDAMKSEKM